MAFSGAFQINAFQNNAFQTSAQIPAGWFPEWDKLRHDPGELEERLQNQRGISRSRIEEILAAEKAAAEAAVLAAAQKEGKTKGQKLRALAMAQAARAAQDAIWEAVERQGAEAELRQLTSALEEAVTAKRLAQSIKMAGLAEAAAIALSARLKEEEDNDEAEALLMIFH